VTTERHPSVPSYVGHVIQHRRKEVPAPCRLEAGPVEFSNLTVSKHNGTIVFAPHVPSACVISLNEKGATKLCDLLTAWLP
jgi:hypothetical protein